MTKKKINAKDFNYILEPSASHRKLDWSRTYTMAKFDNGGYCFTETIKIWLFVLLYIPVTILTFFNCLWDGGLKEFRFPDMPKHVWRLDIWDKGYIADRFNRADEIWEKA